MSLYPLWETTNLTRFSSVFNVPSGQCCVLYAADFAEERYRADAAEIVQPQSVCVRKLLFGFSAEDFAPAACGCSMVYDMMPGAKNLVDQVVSTSNGSWQLTSCNNIGIIGLPGVYRLELNDATAIGISQVYAEWYKAKEIPTHIKDLFFM